MAEEFLLDNGKRKTMKNLFIIIAPKIAKYFVLIISVLTVKQVNLNRLNLMAKHIIPHQVIIGKQLIQMV